MLPEEQKCGLGGAFLKTLSIRKTSFALRFIHHLSLVTLVAAGGLH
jgi:hypothetical protein